MIFTQILSHSNHPSLLQGTNIFNDKISRKGARHPLLRSTCLWFKSQITLIFNHPKVEMRPTLKVKVKED